MAKLGGELGGRLRGHPRVNDTLEPAASKNLILLVFIIRRYLWVYPLGVSFPSAIRPRNFNHGETSRTECDKEEGRADEEEVRHQSQAEEGARPSRIIIIIIIIIAIDPLQIRGSDLAQES